MSWQESFPGHFERPLDSIELFYKTVTDEFTRLNPDREHWTVTVSARFILHPRIGNAQSALRHAWKTMRYDHPQIASFEREGRKVYEVPDLAAIESWLANTFIIARAKTTDDILASAPPPFLSTLYYLPDTSQVVLRVSHYRIDGTGALCLLQNYFTALSKPRQIDFGIEGRNLSPGLDEAASFLMDTAEEDARAATKLFTLYADNLPSVGIPIISANDFAGATCRSALTLSPATTSAVTSACRLRGLSVTIAVHAAVIVATKQLASREPSAKNYTSFVTFDLRPYLRKPYNTAAHPVSVYSVGLPLSLNPSTFSSNAVQLQSFYKQLSPSPSQSAKLPSYLADYIRKMTDLVKQPMPASTPVTAPPVLISLGKINDCIDPTYGDDIELIEFFLATEVLTRQLTFYVWTWRDRMSFSVCYNEQFYNEDFVRGFVERVRGILFGELGLENM